MPLRPISMVSELQEDPTIAREGENCVYLSTLFISFS